MADLVAPTLRAADVVNHGAELAIPNSQGRERLDVLRQAVFDPTNLGLKGAEQPIPQNEDAAIVLVEILGVGAVVHSVMRRRIECRLGDWGHAVNRFGVDPVLIEQVEL